MPRKPTVAQRRALEAIRDGKVQHNMLAMHAAGYSPWTMPHYVRRDTIERVISRGWARVGAHKQPGFVAAVELTDAGRQALA